MTTSGKLGNPVGSILSQTQLAKLRKGYAAGKSSLDGLLRGALPGLYALSANYSNAILDIFYNDPDLPSDKTLSRPQLSTADRERCIIALLASRSDQFNLALHMYIGLMTGISPDEIANILLLAGAYTGVDNFSNSIQLEVQMLTLLSTLTSTAPEAAFESLHAAFSPPPAPQP